METGRLVHELRVHQIELEMQNEELRQMQAQLNAARARYFDLYDLAPVGYVTLSEPGLILEANFTAATLLGAARGALVKQSLTKFILKEDQIIYYQHRKALFEKRTPQACELRMLKHDNTPCWVRLDTTATQDAAGAFVCRVTLTDISAGKRLEAYAEMGRDVLQILNEPGDLNKAIQRVFVALKTRTGFTAVGMRLKQCDDFPYVAQEGFSKDFLLLENTLIERDAQGEVCRDSDGNVSLVCTCGLVIAGKTDPTNPLFTRGGSFWTNNSFALLNLPPEQDPRYHPRNQCIHQGYASVALVPIRNQDKIVGILQFNDVRQGCFSLATVELLEGIAAHLGMALMRKQAEAELLKMQKIQSVGTLAGGIAHDFNNILMSLFGNISLAKDGLAKTHPSHTLLEEAEKSMNRAVRLTKQLLTFAKGGDPVKECVGLGALVEEVATFDLSGSKVSLVYQQDENLWQADADRGQIQQVVSNLVINARQSMPAGGHLYVTLENAAMPAGAMVGLPAGNYVKITIRDEGTGIEAKHLDRMFEPYFTTRPAGHGLGLATAYSIIHKHGGHISVVSELGKGTTFTLHLPVSKAPRQAPLQPPATECPALGRSKSILVMDDEEAVRKIVTRILQSCGFSVATAPDGHAAIEMYRQARAAGAPFDVVIMDLTIPGGIGGEEAIKDLLALDPHAKVIVSSGYAEDPVMANYADYGFKGIAAKPYTKKELWEVLARVLQ
ncbi:MAG: ATP-binding protein [bacterium]|nr:ATP-binding protein [bacterium]